MSQAKPFRISKQEVYDAYLKVRANKGSAGCDRQSLEDFELKLKGNLYKLWNRLSSGCYMPPPVLRVEIPKGNGGTRPLGIPTVADRIAQMVVKQRIEPELERVFHPNSYGYRPRKSAHDALGLARQRCWKRAWVLDMDIKGFFDDIDHELLMKAVRKHVHEKWQLLYIERWLKAPVQLQNGETESRDEGTPQGGVISPILANLFLHYVFDVWIERNWHDPQFERYADDIVCHCRTEREANELKDALTERFGECGLTLHSEKTKVVLCKSSRNRGVSKHEKFDFLGYTFRTRLVNGSKGRFQAFTPAMSPKKAKQIRDTIRGWNILNSTQVTIEEIASYANPRIRGWEEYYSKFGAYEFKRIVFYLNQVLIRWIKRKSKKLSSVKKAYKWLLALMRKKPYLFAHWENNSQRNGWMIRAV